MAETPLPLPSTGAVCRWRTSAETLDVVEALERIEALLLRLERRLDDIDDGRPASPQDEPLRARRSR